MLRTFDLLVIALNYCDAWFSFTPAAAFSGASHDMRPLEIQAGQLPLPPRVPTVRPPTARRTTALSRPEMIWRPLTPTH